MSIRQPGVRLPALLAAVAATLLVLGFSGSPGVAGEGGTEGFRIIAPRDGATLKPGSAVVIGTAPPGGSPRVEVDVNGKAAPAGAVSGGAFRISVYLMPGKNVIRVGAGERQAVTTVTAAEAGVYRYHPDVEKCAECHGDGTKGYRVAGPTESLCHRCHDRKDGGKHVHGPLGGGDCTACHEPHGSANPALTIARAEGLCTICHDQKSSEKHLKGARGKACTDCHEPHSSSKAFLQR